MDGGPEPAGSEGFARTEAGGGPAASCRGLWGWPLAGSERGSGPDPTDDRSGERSPLRPGLQGASAPRRPRARCSPKTLPEPWTARTFAGPVRAVLGVDVRIALRVPLRPRGAACPARSAEPPASRTKCGGVERPRGGGWGWGLNRDRVWSTREFGEETSRPGGRSGGDRGHNVRRPSLAWLVGVRPAGLRPRLLQRQRRGRRAGGRTTGGLIVFNDAGFYTSGGSTKIRTLTVVKSAIAPETSAPPEVRHFGNTPRKEVQSSSAIL